MGMVAPPEMKKLLLTGSSGFLGRHILRAVQSDFDVTTLSQVDADLNIDLSSSVPEGLPAVDMVVHAAGLAHIMHPTAANADAFHKVNYAGTANLLQGLEASGSLPQCFVFISTVAVYGKDKGEGINEDEPLLAKDPYGLSKIRAEALLTDWCQLHQVRLLILRLPLLVGENPPGNLGLMLKAIQKGRFFTVGGGIARKSMVLVTDIASFIAHAYSLEGTYNLTDGHHPHFKELSIHIANQLGKSSVYNIPFFMARLLALVGDLMGEKFPVNNKRLAKLLSTLTFDDSKARKTIGWNPTPVLKGLTLKPT
jgi:nucleoside-diphosphate-sugar epimerase